MKSKKGYRLILHDLIESIKGTRPGRVKRGTTGKLVKYQGWAKKPEAGGSLVADLFIRVSLPADEWSKEGMC